jgi:hypothetical protein
VPQVLLLFHVQQEENAQEQRLVHCAKEQWHRGI